MIISHRDSDLDPFSNIAILFDILAESKQMAHFVLHEG